MSNNDEQEKPKKEPHRSRSKSFLERFWGRDSNLPQQLAALLLIMLLLAGIIYTFVHGSSSKDFWAILSPFVTLLMVFLFKGGQGKSPE